MSGFKEETIMLKEILDEKMDRVSKTMFFITNVNNNIIVQTMTTDFNFKIINYIHKRKQSIFFPNFKYNKHMYIDYPNRNKRN